jgi:hypothetical protein
MLPVLLTMHIGGIQTLANDVKFMQSTGFVLEIGF